jgi:PEP-CTERM motif
VKTGMKVVLLGLVLVVAAAGASANAVDPSIIIRDPLGCPANNCIVLTSNTWSFNVPSGGFGLLHFLNSSGNDWTMLILTELGVAANLVSCQSDVFSCSVVPFGQNGAQIILTATGGLPGLPDNTSFEILLACGSCPKWPAGLLFNAAAGAVPEPGTMALLLTGVGAIYARRKLRAKVAA